MLAARVYSGRITQQIKEQFTELTRQAFSDFVRDRVNSRLTSALQSEDGTRMEAESAGAGEDAEPHEPDDGIETTEDERRAFRIVQAIGAEIVNPDRIAIRDTKSYCSVLLDDNNRKPICRLHFLKTKRAISVFTPAGQRREDIERLEEIYRLREDIKSAIRQYDQPSPAPGEAGAEADEQPQPPPSS